MNGNTGKFSGKSRYYQLARPSYPRKATEWLYRKTCASSVADIGAGTGIFTRCLLDHPWQVCAVEPNTDMREEFTAILPDTVCYSGTAENTGLPEKSVQLVTAAQAFHWFDEELFRKECRRILTADGKVAVIWNNRLAEGIGAAHDEVSKKYCPAFRKGHTGKRSAADGDIFLRNSYLIDCEVFSIRHTFPMTFEIFLANALSRSYAPKADDPVLPAFTDELRGVFEKFAKNGIASEEYENVIYLGRI